MDVNNPDEKYPAMPEHNQACSELARLVDIVKKLRSENGCPWDRKQTEETLKPFVIEEAYEVADAISSGNSVEIMEELGDLMLQVVFLSDIYEDKDWFSLEGAIRSVNEKLIRRHPHVFDENFKLESGECMEDAILRNWERIKAEEKKEKLKNSPEKAAKPSVFVPETMPSLHRANMVQEKAKRQGLDFKSAEEIFGKISEEIGEFRNELDESGPDGKSSASKLEEEYGDILFSVVNLGRFLGIHPCNALNVSSDKFIERVGRMENSSKVPLSEMDADSLDSLWEESKKTV